MVDFALTPFVATVIFVVGCLAGFKFRRTWANEGPRWQLWVFGTLAAAAFLLVGFVPLSA